MAAVGRLLLGEIRDWSEFLAADADVTALPRRVLRTAKHDVYRRLRPEAKRFFERSFEGMTGAVLSRLYDAIRHNQGLEMPLGQFEREYAGISPIALKDAPAHATVKISLWGLQFEFPELHLSRDVREALRAARKAQAALAKWRAKRHSEVVTAKTEIGGLIRTQLFASRSCVLASTHLVEAFLNGVAWDFAQDSDVLSNLTERDRRLVVEQSC